jgi:hypothetical protein
LHTSIPLILTYAADGKKTLGYLKELKKINQGPIKHIVILLYKNDFLGNQAITVCRVRIIQIRVGLYQQTSIIKEERVLIKFFKFENDT